MKILFVITLDLVFIFGFFLLGHHRNKNLAGQVEQLELAIDSKQDVQIAIENFRIEQSQIIEQDRAVSKLEPLKYQTTDFLFNLVSHLPKGISLVELTKFEHTFLISGEAASKKDLDSFLDQRHLKLLKLKRLSFEASGNI
ncbi:MAG: hypothetical protein WCK42_07475 [Myxococcaceae bacterium]